MLAQIRTEIEKENVQIDFIGCRTPDGDVFSIFTRSVSKTYRPASFFHAGKKVLAGRIEFWISWLY